MVLEALVSDGGQFLEGGFSMLGTKKVERESVEVACNYVLMRYRELVKGLGEVIEDLPALVLPERELRQRNACVSTAVTCALVGLLSMLIGIPLPFSAVMFGSAVTFGIESIGISLWCKRVRRKENEIRLPFNEVRALEIVLEQLDSVVGAIEGLQRVMVTHQQQMTQFRQKISELNAEELTHAECIAVLYNSVEEKIFLEVSFSPEGCGMYYQAKFDVADEYSEFLEWIEQVRISG